MIAANRLTAVVLLGAACDVAGLTVAAAPRSQAPSVLAIHEIQGRGNRSPFAGARVTTSGVVTARKTNGFFIQSPEGEADQDPDTSEGLFVFTSSAPPAVAAAGSLVDVEGVIAEFVPAADPHSPPLTEIVSPIVRLVSTANAPPAPVTLGVVSLEPRGSVEQLEKYEAMRVRVNALTVVAPTQGTINESSGAATSNGVFFGVIAGHGRPFREPGIEAPNPIPPCATVHRPCRVPVFDANPERLRVDSDGQTGAIALDVATGATVSNLIGPLDYAFRTYTILPDPGSPPVVTGGLEWTPAPTPAADQFTVATLNMRRFFDEVNDPGISEPVLAPTAFINRVGKAALLVRTALVLPDVIAVQEVENLRTLQAIANRINADAERAGGPDPGYVALLEEGNDPSGIDVGALVRTSRVHVVGVEQEGKSVVFTGPGGRPEMLNDRPPLVVRVEMAAPDGQPFRWTIVVNHLRSLSGINDPADGPRVRAKRRAQAEFLANLIGGRLGTDPYERLIATGDFNAFPFNDGYVDTIATVKGTPTPSDRVALDSGDLVDPDLTDLGESAPPAERYSYIFDGNAQLLDHALASPTLLDCFSAIAHVRVNADFAEIRSGDPRRPERLSDHDPVVAYFSFGCEPPEG